MEIVLALLFAVASVVAVWSLTLLGIERERRRRADDELAALRVLSRGPLSQGEVVAAPDLPEGPREVEGAPASRPDADLRDAVSRALPAISRALELAAARQARRESLAGAERSPGASGEGAIVGPGGPGDGGFAGAVRPGGPGDGFAAGAVRPGGPGDGFAAAASALRELLHAATRAEEELTSLLGEAGDLRRRLASREEPAAWPPISLPASPAASLGVASRHGEAMADQEQRLRALLITTSLQASRLSASVRALDKSASGLGRRAESLVPLTASLSGLADRVNLLALNAAFLGGDEAPEGRGQAAHETEGVTAAELRAVYDELRVISRDLHAAAQSAQDGSVAVQESLAASLELSETVQGSAGRVVDRLTSLDGAAQTLLESLGGAQRLAAEAEEVQRALLRRVSAAAEREALAVRELAERNDDVAVVVARLEKALSSVRELRHPANVALGALEDARASSEPAPELEASLLRALSELERAATASSGPSPSPSPRDAPSWSDAPFPA